MDAVQDVQVKTERLAKTTRRGYNGEIWWQNAAAAAREIYRSLLGLPSGAAFNRHARVPTITIVVDISESVVGR